MEQALGWVSLYFQSCASSAPHCNVVFYIAALYLRISDFILNSPHARIISLTSENLLRREEGGARHPRVLLHPAQADAAA